MTTLHPIACHVQTHRYSKYQPTSLVGSIAETAFGWHGCSSNTNGCGRGQNSYGVMCRTQTCVLSCCLLTSSTYAFSGFLVVVEMALLVTWTCTITHQVIHDWWFLCELLSLCMVKYFHIRHTYFAISREYKSICCHKSCQLPK